jgi:glucan 1,3-beta-glucosidase
MDDIGTARPYATEKRAMYTAPRDQSKKRLVLILVAVAVLLIIAAVMIPLYFAVIRPKLLQNNASDHVTSTNNDGNTDTKGDGNKHNNLVTWGNDGSVVEMEDGTKFTYNNKLGGYWVWDPANPTNNSARAQSSSPALNEEFKYGVDRIRG